LLWESWSDESSIASSQLEEEPITKDTPKEDAPSIAPSVLDMQAEIAALKTALSASASGTTSGPQKTQFKPLLPTIGGIKELTPTDFVAWDWWKAEPRVDRK
jgi:hypothetical protein